MALEGSRAFVTITSIMWIADEVEDETQANDVPCGAVRRFVQKHEILLTNFGMAGPEVDGMTVDPG